MLILRNGATLRRDRAFHPLIDAVAEALAPGAHAHGVQRLAPAPQRPTPWLVLQGERDAGEGLAVWTDTLDRSATSLRRASSHVRYAALLMARFGGMGGLSLVMSDAVAPAPSWLCFNVQVNGDSFVFACSEGVIERGVWNCEPPRRRMMVALPVIGVVLPWEGHELRLRELRVMIPSLHREGIMRTGTGSGLRIEIVEGEMVEEEPKVIVQVELGELEVELESLLSLRPGSVVEVGGQMPLVCALRLGSSRIAQGLLELQESGFLLRIVDSGLQAQECAPPAQLLSALAD